MLNTLAFYPLLLFLAAFPACLSLTKALLYRFSPVSSDFYDALCYFASFVPIWSADCFEFRNWLCIIS